MEPQREGTNPKSEMPGTGYYTFLVVFGIILMIAGIVTGVMLMRDPEDSAVHTLNFRKLNSYARTLEKGHYQIWYVDIYGEYDLVEGNDPGEVYVKDSSGGNVLLIEEDASIEGEYDEWVIFASFEAEETGEYTFTTSKAVEIYITTPYLEEPYYYTLVPFAIGCGGGLALMYVGIAYIKRIQQMREAEKKAKIEYWQG
ncbi:MAG: hypothetical protein QF682_12845 [Candidatus Thermoplasmatota archaeon]|jgi:hypothetical protein|nr:hypothetical protein [Candidatus Thermoplasmatota archaeon]